MTQNLPQSVQTGANIGVYGVVVVGWLDLIQPWLTALATVLAIVWTCIQIYNWYKKRQK